MIRTVFSAVVLVAAPVVLAQSPDAVLAYYEKQAKRADSAFAASAERGKAFYFAQRRDGDETAGCTDCHGEHPTERGRTRAYKPLNPLAPSVNPESLTEINHVEKWMSRGCKDVLDRPCTVQEKADVVRFLISVK